MAWYAWLHGSSGNHVINSKTIIANREGRVTPAQLNRMRFDFVVAIPILLLIVLISPFYLCGGLPPPLTTMIICGVVLWGSILYLKDLWRAMTQKTEIQVVRGWLDREQTPWLDANPGYFVMIGAGVQNRYKVSKQVFDSVSVHTEYIFYIQPEFHHLLSLEQVLPVSYKRSSPGAKPHMKQTN